MPKVRVHRPSRRAALAAALAVVAGLLAVGAAPSRAADTPRFISYSVSFRSTDGTMLHASIGGFGSLRPRPVIVEDSPYAPAVSSLNWLGTAYNYVELQWRGTGLSAGALSTIGPADQHDLSAFLGWACQQPWSDGRIGIYGFSASAIVAYNSMHLPMPCVKAASLMAGSVDLYRDLLDIGGIANLAAGAFVETAIGAPTLLSGLQRLKTEPQTSVTTLAGYPKAALDVLGNPTENAFWRARTFRGDRDRIPILADTSFYDVEPRGPFRAYNATKQYGSHLLVYGAHDGHPAGTPGPFPQYRNWFDHYLLGKPLSDANHDQVSVYASNGSREQFLADHVTHLTGSTWPLRRTRWTPFYLSAQRSGSVGSINDGTLTLAPPRSVTTQSYPFAPSDPTETDPHTIGVVAGAGLDQAATALPALTDMQLSAPTSLTYTTPPLQRPLTVVGPGAVDIAVSSAAPVTDLYLVVADVQPDGTAYPVGTGALRTAYPRVDKSRSLVDDGQIVDPYNDFTHRDVATVGKTRHYQVELLPVGNRFDAGDRIRLYVLGTPVDQLGSPPGLNSVRLGGIAASRLLLPSIGRTPQAALTPTTRAHDRGRKHVPNRLVTITIPATHGRIPAKWLSYPGPPRAAVLLPEDYDPHKRYPLVLNLGGLGGNYARAAFGTGLHIQAIVVTPEPGSGWYTDWWNNGERRDPAWESYYLDDVLPTILARYPIRPERRFHAIVGISMGGLGATYLGGRLPGFFGSVASLSGFVDPQFFGLITGEAMGWTSLAPFHGDQNLYAVYGPPSGFYATGHNPTRLVQNLSQTRVLATSGTGVPSQAGLANPELAVPGGALEGMIIRPMNDAFHTAATAARIDLTFRSHPGGHDAPDFSNEINEWLAWGPFKPVTSNPRSWTNSTVATSGRLWGIGYRFALPPTRVVSFRRSGDSLAISRAGTDVTITVDGCRLRTTTPATIDLPRTGCTSRQR